MSKKSSSSGYNDFPKKILNISNKKREQNGEISYLVRYRDENISAWAAKSYLCKDPYNKKMI